MPTQLTAEHISRLIILRHRLIERGPDRFAMEYWFTKYDNADTVETCDWYELSRQPEHFRQFIESPNATSCGTAACIAGHAMTIWPNALKRADVEDVAEYLGMHVEATGSGDEWFAVGNWPDRFRHPRAELANELAWKMREEPYDRDRWVEMDIDRQSTLRAFDHRCIIEMLDDLIHGRRLHWWDESTEAADRADLVDAQEV